MHAAILFLAVATSYCDTGLTATGRPAVDGTIAVDPTVIPLRSRIRLAIGDAQDRIGHLMQRRFRTITFYAGDTGRLIKGKRIDLWMPSCANALRWGRRTVRVEVLHTTARASEKRAIARSGYTPPAQHVARPCSIADRATAPMNVTIKHTPAVSSQYEPARALRKS
jgi:3D (Asp-Asp-Asp) domain-containing protein